MRNQYLRLELRTSCVAGEVLPIRTTEADERIAVGDALTVGPTDAPSALMDEAVVVTTEQQGVAEVRGATLRPRGDVVCVGVPRGSRATGETTAAITYGQCATLSGGEEACGTSELEWDTVGTQHDARDVCIASETLTRQPGERDTLPR